jgi:hypothetical protein
VLLKAAKAKAFEESLRKLSEVGFMSMIDSTPPGGRMRKASENIDLVGRNEA